MIASISLDTLSTKCPMCQTDRDISVADLQLGVSGPYELCRDTIALSPCACGAISFLVRTWDSTPANGIGTRHDRQRRSVNALAQHLKSQGKSHPDHAAAHAAETSAPPDLVELPATVISK